MDIPDTDWAQRWALNGCDVTVYADHAVDQARARGVEPRHRDEYIAEAQRLAREYADVATTVRSAYVVRRAGDAPLAFAGELVAEASGARGNAQRWHRIAVYRTDSGRWVLQIAWRTRWQGELDVIDAWIEDSPSAIVARLRAYDPLAHLIGYPPGAQFAAKRARLERELRQAWGALVSALLADAGDCFSERI